MSLDEMVARWKEVRAGLIAEITQIPAERFGFQATPQSRSVAGILRHIVETQKFATGELCRPDTDFGRVPIRELVARDAAVSYSGGDKEELIASLRSTMEEAEATLRAFGNEALSENLHGLLSEKEEGLDTKSMSKLDLLYSYISHEMYHRGQISVYERLMNIEPAATAKLREYLASNA